MGSGASAASMWGLRRCRGALWGRSPCVMAAPAGRQCALLRAVGEVGESVRAVFSSLVRFHEQLNFGDDVLKLTVDLCKLQSLPTLNLENFSHLLQQHILELQCVSDKLNLLVREDASGTRNSVEKSPSAKPDSDLNSTTTSLKQMWNQSINPRTKMFQKEAQCKLEEQDESNIQSGTELVQIKASKDEIERRISAFIERKQAEINENNIREFCNVINCNLENSCARTDAVFTPHPGFKSHIKVSRVVNMYGPQTRTESEGESAQKPNSVTQNCGNPAIEERLQNMEAHLKLPPGGPVPVDVYQRIKKLEDRILHLEGLSPEYFQHVNLPNKRRKVQETVQGYSLIEIDEKINALKAVLLQKASGQAQSMKANKMST
ncbi:MAP3K12-binding inhibitory protein 1 isoform X1 [Hypanus sabinus]|uniref:MAP3K12-binding inhibitory protein 1 isoform X1 n=1 Tax=Hypanus sabinus TaxID=79690 RepID=UPI0028C37A19|nr:MAP3K12-binding inhibitory protein 1 isoform X1 [Hypanus sabinus]